MWLGACHTRFFISVTICILPHHKKELQKWYSLQTPYCVFEHDGHTTNTIYDSTSWPYALRYISNYKLWVMAHWWLAVDSREAKGVGELWRVIGYSYILSFTVNRKETRLVRWYRGVFSLTLEKKDHDQLSHLKITLCYSIFLPYELTLYHSSVNLSRFQMMK